MMVILVIISSSVTPPPPPLYTPSIKRRIRQGVEGASESSAAGPGLHT